MHGWLLADGKYECSHCHKQVSVTAGTILHRSHIPLTKWFLAFYLVMSDKRGISAVELSKSIGVTYLHRKYFAAIVKAWNSRFPS